MVSSSGTALLKCDSIIITSLPATTYGRPTDRVKQPMIWTANEIERRYESAGLHAYSLNPGMIASGLQKHVTEDMMKEWSTVSGLQDVLKLPEQGAANAAMIVWAAMAQVLEGGKGGNTSRTVRFLGHWSQAMRLG
ncbi:hypothetical protein BDW59DRAFT_165305 [Aspergillus cavernicola]|uniref:NAD(P)-binding protein n=1 Tax=Aspergillus cavernicola TaxID=176166 RepID=A0ABR4HTE4_9EURO